MKKKVLWITLGVILLITGGLYIQKAIYYQTHFLPRTSFNQTDISNQTIEEAEKTIEKAKLNNQLDIKMGDRVIKSIAYQDILITQSINENLDNQLNKQSVWTWPLSYFKEHSIKVDAIIDQQKLTQIDNQMKKFISDYNKDKRDATNATVVFDTASNKFIMTDSSPGTKLDMNAALNKIKTALEKQDQEVQLNDTVVQPTVVKNDETLSKNMEQLNKIANIKAEYSFNDQKVTIPNDKIREWLTLDDKGNITINQEKVKKYVQDIANEYNTYGGKNIKFQSTKQGEVDVPCETYSWSINVPEETKGLSEQILKGEDFTRIPITQGSASAKGPLIGKTYIEVDKTAQHMWVYKDGKEVISTDIVTGKPNTPTPSGVFYIWKKERNAVLKGADYESPVSYWMPIDWTGVGIHDSNWQSAYGGTRWKDGFGSHGCINTPPNIMKNVYEQVEVGTPVIIIE